jgi:hypothetical protein
MILVKVHEGLSNQMFQYAAARRLAAVHATSVRLDLSWYDDIPAGATPRSFELHHLQITGQRATRRETIGTGGVRNAPLKDLPTALYRKIRPRYRYVGERHFHFDPTVLDLPDNVCLYGYWMSEKYFADAAEIIRREFQFRNPPSPENQKMITRMTEIDSVAVHVRRGDYVSDANAAAAQGLCGLDYYRRCAETIKDRIQDPCYFVFSDDLDWARDHLSLGGDTEYVDHNRGSASYEDLRLMACARHNVIANSGFSWWAAWLNPNPSKLILAPQRWMKDSSFDTSDVLPAEWVTV